MGTKLTAEQAEMVRSCLALDAAWTTGTSGANYELLLDWCRQGWAEPIPPPSGLHSLAAFKFTPAGREALREASHEH